MKRLVAPACGSTLRFALILPIAALIGTLLLPVVAGAQTPFALRSVGQRLAQDDARIQGRGGWGLTIADSLHPGFKNPASLSGIRHVVFAFTGYGERVSSESPTDSRTTSRVYTPQVRAAVPVIKGRLALTAGLSVERSAQWNTFIDSTWTVWDDTLTGNEQFTREGTTFKVPLGVAWQATSWLSVAGAFNLESGSLRESLANFYLSPTTSTGSPFYGANLRVAEDHYTGTSLTAGALMTWGERLRVGGTYTAAHDIDVDHKVELAGIAERMTSVSSYSRPAELALGLSAQLAGRWSSGVDVQLMNYTEFEGQEDWASDLEDEVIVGFGFERRRASARHGGWSNLPLRMGAGWRRWAYHVGGAEVEEKTFSVGTGFPFNRGLGQLDVGVSYSLVGDQETNGMESRVWRLAVSVTGLEAWW